MDTKKVSSDGEDIPSDFFDDFSKEEFIAGLSVIDSWDDSEKPNSPRIDLQKLDRVRDLRDLIKGEVPVEKKSKYKWVRSDLQVSSKKRRSEKDKNSNNDKLFNIKPGSRRDPNKTNEAIKKDKELKVKEHLAKHLESSHDLRPPGTELDDFFDISGKHNKNIVENYKPPIFNESIMPENMQSTVKYEGSTKCRESPVQHREFSSRRYESPSRFRGSLSRRRNSPVYRRQGSSPQNRRQHLSPRRRHYGHASRSRSPQYRNMRRHYPSSSSDHRRLPSRSSYTRRSRSPLYSPPKKPRHDDFLYPKEFSQYVNNNVESYNVQPQYMCSMPNVPPLLEGSQNYDSYPQAPIYQAYGTQYDYSNQQVLPPVMPVPQPVPPPTIVQSSLNPSMTVNSISLPMIPPPQQPIPSSVNIKMPHKLEPHQEPSIALAKLVADGKLSHEDYLKLVPNKGLKAMDTNTRIAVLNRCNAGLSKLGVLIPPNRLLINNNLIGLEPKPLLPKFCSPLKRQAVVEFHFTKYNDSTVALQNQHILKSLISTLSLDKIVNPTMKTVQKNMQDAAVQTVKPFCDVCDIRESIKCEEIGTSTDPEYISTSVHTQVEEQDLINSKAMFNPSGSVAGGAPISIAHMTPAQLVSQLAARAKSLKQTDPNPGHQFHGSRDPYDYENRRDHGFRNNYNYRY